MSSLSELVYALTMIVPPGFVTTYSSIASILGVSPRVVGAALSANKNPIVVPCHRVVRSNGELGGYRFGGARVKRLLLELEGVRFEGDRVLRTHIIDLRDLL